MTRFSIFPFFHLTALYSPVPAPPSAPLPSSSPPLLIFVPLFCSVAENEGENEIMSTYMCVAKVTATQFTSVDYNFIISYVYTNSYTVLATRFDAVK